MRTKLKSTGFCGHCGIQLQVPSWFYCNDHDKEHKRIRKGKGRGLTRGANNRKEAMEMHQANACARL